jgi:hypothetical protein
MPYRLTRTGAHVCPVGVYLLGTRLAPHAACVDLSTHIYKPLTHTDVSLVLTSTLAVQALGYPEAGPAHGQY